MKRFKPIALWLGALIVVATALLCVESDFLWKIQQYNLRYLKTKQERMGHTLHL